MRARRGMTLVFVLTGLALAAALIAPLATASAIRAGAARRDADELRHRLAGDSLLALLPQWLSRPEVQRALAHANAARFEFELDGALVGADIQDDTAKLPAPRVFELGADRLSHSLLRLQHSAGLADLGIRRAESSPLCLEDCFEAPTDAALYGSPVSARTWAAYVTPLGRAVHVRRAAEPVLTALLADIDPELGGRIAAAARRSPAQGLEELLAEVDVLSGQRRAVQERLTLRTERYSVLLSTTSGRDVRWRYVIIAADESATVLADWEVTP